MKRIEHLGLKRGDIFAYSTDPRYDGGDESLLKAEDMRKVCRPTNIEG